MSRGPWEASTGVVGGLCLERSPELLCGKEKGLEEWRRTKGRWTQSWRQWAGAKPPSLNGGPCPTGVWPQFRTIQDKEVTILNSTECESLYHRFSKIPSDSDHQLPDDFCKGRQQEQFCYVSISPPCSLASRGTWPGMGLGEQGSQDLRGGGEGDGDEQG